MGNLRLVISLRPQNRVCIDFFLSVNIQFRAQIILFYFYLNEAFQIRVVIPREERGIEEFDGEEFLARKSGEENEELTGLNRDLFRGKTRKLRKKVQEKLKKN